MNSRKITVRGIFSESGELIRIFHQNGGGKTYFMDCEPSNDASIDEFCMELMPPEDKAPAIQANGALDPAAEAPAK